VVRPLRRHEGSGAEFLTEIQIELDAYRTGKRRFTCESLRSLPERGNQRHREPRIAMPFSWGETRTRITSEGNSCRWWWLKRRSRPLWLWNRVRSGAWSEFECHG
jgi:hypothetical protein